MVSWAYDAGAGPAVAQRDAGRASLHTTLGYMHLVDKVVGSERLVAMKVMYYGVDGASAPSATVPASVTAIARCGCPPPDDSDRQVGVAGHF